MLLRVAHRNATARALKAQLVRPLSNAGANGTVNHEALVKQRASAVKQELATLAAAFRRYDGDGNGFLDRGELLSAMSDLELPAGEVDVDTLFRTLDANNDGAIQLNEWLDHLPRGARVKIVNDKSHRTVRISIPDNSKIVYTYTDEAPMLATYSLLPIIRAFVGSSSIDLELKDISVAGRILANFPDYLEHQQRVHDELTELGELAKTPRANIIKLPNVSAALPQLLEAITELQGQGFAVPPYPVNPANDEEEAVKARYAKVLGSSVNPVLREGNSDRRVAQPVKDHARAHPHKLKPYAPDSKTHVSHMSEGDFFGSEQSRTCAEPCTVRIEHVDTGGKVTVLKPKTSLQRGEVIDAARLDVVKLQEFYAREMAETKALGDGVLLSLHLKATMMKVSDPIMFGHAVKVFYESALSKHAEVLTEVGFNPNNGIGDLYSKLEGHPQEAAVLADVMAVYATQPPLAMVDSGKGITNLHAPNDVIIDASVPPVIRDGGKMWNWDDQLADTKMLIPDRSYATMYAAVVDDCKAHGAFDVATMGNVANVGLMAQKAEEYGSHPNTFEVESGGVVRVVDVKGGDVVFEHGVSTGDVWRMCQTKDAPIVDWVKLAVARAKATGNPAVFWLDEKRAHDANLILKVNEYLPLCDTTGVEVLVLPPAEAMHYTCKRVRAGLDTVSVTGNVLRDYLTDLFPILELGTSAKMLSIVPLLAGGGLFETGAGGSAPKHVTQLLKENHLRWDSLGEFLALAVSIEDLALKTDNTKAKAIGEALSVAVGKILSEGKSPSRKCHEIDNRGSHFYLALFWAEALASQGGELGTEFATLASELRLNEKSIVEELNQVQGSSVDLGGYYNPDAAKAEAVMRPSRTLNGIIDSHMSANAEFFAK